MVHMRAEHQGCSAADTLQCPDDIESPLLDFLIFNLHPQLFELAAEILPHFFLLARDADDISEVAREFHDPMSIHLLQRLQFHPLSSLYSKEIQMLKIFCSIFASVMTRNRVDGWRRF